MATVADKGTWEESTTVGSLGWDWAHEGPQDWVKVQAHPTKGDGR